MGTGSSWRPGSVAGSGRREPRASWHNTHYQSYKPDYSRSSPPNDQNANPERDSRKPDYPKSRGPRDGPGRNPHRIQKSKPDSHRGSEKYSVNTIKKQLHNLNRQLRLDLPADVRVEKERAVAGYERDLELALQEKKKQDMISKYHMVRFFERQKATRNVKKCTKSLAECPRDDPNYQNLQQALHTAEVDFAYTQYSPLYQKYEALFPQRKDAPENNNEDTPNEQKPPPRPAMWALVEKCMEQGTLDDLRNGTLGDEDSVLSFAKMKPFKHHQLAIRSMPSATQSIPSIKPSRFARKLNYNNDLDAAVDGQKADEMDEDSDGGFFEEVGGVRVDMP